MEVEGVDDTLVVGKREDKRPPPPIEARPLWSHTTGAQTKMPLPPTKQGEHGESSHPTHTIPLSNTLEIIIASKW